MYGDIIYTKRPLSIVEILYLILEFSPKWLAKSCKKYLIESFTNEYEAAFKLAGDDEMLFIACFASLVSSNHVRQAFVDALRVHPLFYVVFLFLDTLCYCHYGVETYDFKVAHFTTYPGSSNIGNAKIYETSIKAFLEYQRFIGGSYKECVIYPEFRVKAKYSKEEVVERAKRYIGSDFGGYHLLMNNCEHFANWCATNEKKSRQASIVIFKKWIEDFFWDALTGNRAAILRKKADLDEAYADRIVKEIELYIKEFEGKLENKISDFRKKLWELDENLESSLDDGNNEAALKALYEFSNLINPNNNKPRLSFEKFSQLMITDDRPLIL